MSAVQLRQRRKTAGKRINSLIGKALQDDNTFWNHNTWQEQDSDNDTGNESFRDSDQDSSLKQDAFDSDFNDSETDDDDERDEAGRQAEAILAQQEKQDKRKHKLNNTHMSKAMDIARAGRATQHKRKHKTKSQRVFGDGHNAGLVLNFPQQPIPTNNHHHNNNTLPTASIGIPTTVTAITTNKPTTTTKPTTTNKPTTRNKRHIQQHTTPKRSLRATTQEKSAESNKQANTTTATAQAKSQAAKLNTHATRKRKAKRFTQEELLLEAATVTEPLNERWLLGRKRLHEQAEATQKAAAATAAQNQAGGKMLHRYVSRRGYLNTITFAEMDAVPAVLTQSDRPVEPTTAVLCAITGKRARYKCPKTGEGYYDLAAFRELRRRWSNSLPLRSEGDGADCVDDKGGNDTGDVVAMDLEPTSSPPTAAVVSETPPPAAAAVMCSSLEVPALAGECVGSEESRKKCVETTLGTSPSDVVSETKSSDVPVDSVPSPPEEAVESGTPGTVVACVLPGESKPPLSSSTPTPASGGASGVDDGGTSEAPVVSESTTVSVVVEAPDESSGHSS